MIAIHYNKNTGHTGRLWRERFKSCVLEDAVYFLNTGAYIARNPERANIAKVEDYPFGSTIYLYKLTHPFPEFEEFRDMFEEPYHGYFEQIKKLIEAQRTGEQIPRGISMVSQGIGRPKKG